MRESVQKKPGWLKVRLSATDESGYVEDVISRYGLHTVCQSAACPNQGECFNKKTATFMIMGKTCTRNCRFCNVEPGMAGPLDMEEPHRIAEACARLGLKHCVITSVTRDDLEDGGANHFAATVRAVKKTIPDAVIEILIPDFQGRKEDLETVIDAKPHVLNHNIETVPRLYPEIRPQALYSRSLELIRRTKKINPDVYTKSGLMLGLGETGEEVRGVLSDLRDAGCDLLTVGQYLSPSKSHFPVREYVHPDVFKEYEEEALKMGYLSASAGPFVRSSYNAESFFKSVQGNFGYNG